MSGPPPQPAHAEASSSRRSARQPAVDDADDENDEELLSADPLDGDLAAGYTSSFAVIKFNANMSNVVPPSSERLGRPRSLSLNSCQNHYHLLHPAIHHLRIILQIHEIAQAASI